MPLSFCASRPNRRAFSGYLGIFVSCAFFFATLRSWVDDDIPSPQREDGLCTLKEYDDGEWVMRKEGPFNDLAEMKAAYELWPNHHSVCLPPYSEPNFDWALSKRHVKRILNTASYEWKPRTGCKLVAWDRDGFIVKLLQSYGGLWLVGDSLTEQHFDAILSLLASPTSPVFTLGSDLWLKGDDPRAAALIKRAGVPWSRTSRRLVTTARHDRLLDESDLKYFWEEAGVDSFHQNNLGSENAYGAFWDELEAQSEQHGSDPDADRFSNTLAVLNTGAHWGPHHVNVNNTKDLLAGYEETSRGIMYRLSTISNLDAFWRTTSPAHVSCKERTAPDPTLNTYQVADTKDPTEKALAAKRGWDLFPAFNQIWRDLVKEERRRGGTITLIDAWRLANQRGDSHRQPGFDCLHVCHPTIGAHWTYMLWHALSLGAEASAEPPRVRWWEALEYIAMRYPGF